MPAVLLALASFTLRLIMLDRYLHYDESYCWLHYGSGALWEAIHTYSAPNNHVFHSVCMWLSTHSFGLSVVALRVPAFLFGVALVPLTYLLGREVSGPVGSLVAAALVGGCDILASYSVEARGYTVQAALFFAALLIVPRFVRQPSAMLAVAFAVVLSLATFTIPTLVYGVPIPFIWGSALACAEAEGSRRRVLWLACAGVLAGLLTAALYTPALLYVRSVGMAWGSPLQPRSLTGMYAELLAYFLAALPNGAGVLVLVLVATGAVLESRPRHRLPLAATWIGVPLAALALHMMLTARPPFARNFLFVIPLLFVLCGRAIDNAVALAPPSVRRLVLRATLPAATALFLWTASSTYGRYRDAMRLLGSNSHYLFEHLVRPLRVGDELSATNEVLVPIQLYALIAGVPLAPPRGGWQMGNTQRTPSGGNRARPLSVSGQRFFLLAMEPEDRRRIPRELQTELERGRYGWVERQRLPANADRTATLWELAPSGLGIEPATRNRNAKLPRGRRHHARALR